MTFENQERALKLERARLSGQVDELLDRAEKENRGLSAEEGRHLERVEERMGELTANIGRLETEQRISRENEIARAPFANIVRPAIGMNDSGMSQRAWDQASFAFFPMRAALETRDLLVGTTTAGGHTVPTTLERRLYEKLQEMWSIPNLGCTVFTTTSGEPLDVPLTSTFGTAAIVGEGTAISESDPSFAKTTFSSWKYGNLIQVSNELLSDSGVDIEGFLARNAAIALSNAYGPHFISGTGTNQPQGIFTACGTGATAQTGATGVPSYDNIMELMHTVTFPYRKNAKFLTSDANVGKLRRIKDTTGRPLWEPSLQAGQPDVLNGHEVVTDPNVAAFSTAAATAKPLAFGSFAGYGFRDAGTVMERSNDYAFDKDLVTWRIKSRVDGRLIDSSAIKLLVDPTT